jgi:hypothetical protein
MPIGHFNILCINEWSVARETLNTFKHHSKYTLDLTRAALIPESEKLWILLEFGPGRPSVSMWSPLYSSTASLFSDHFRGNITRIHHSMVTC